MDSRPPEAPGLEAYSGQKYSPTDERRGLRKGKGGQQARLKAAKGIDAAQRTGRRLVMDDSRIGAHMGISAILLLAAIGGWGAFAYATYSARQQERTFRDIMAQTIGERDALRTEANQFRADAERTRQALERSQAELVKARTPPSPLPAAPPPPVTPPRTTPPPPGAAPRTPPVR